jgi:hypothetical protein
MIRKSLNDPEYSAKMLNILKAQGAFSPEMQRKKKEEEISNAVSGFIPNFAKIFDLVKNFSSTLSPKLKLSKSSDNRLDENDSVNLIGNRFNKLFVPKKDGEDSKRYEERVLSELGYTPSIGLNFKGNAAIDGYKNATSFAEVKSGFYNEQDTKLKFLRALVENYGTNNQLDIWTSNIDDFKVNGLLIHSDESDVSDKSKPSQLRKDFQMSDALRANKYNRPKRFSKGYIPNFVSQKYVMDTLARIKAGTSGFSKQEQETFLNKFGAKSTGKKISLREVYDKLDGEVGIAQLIDKAYSAAGLTASNEEVYRMFEKQTKANPYLLRSLVSKKGFIPNFADPLKEAIGREMSAGVPASQIYVDQNSSLKNPMNPMGLMVANRRDEPSSGMQGINRARKEGANPMLYGAAGGFVPNYASIPAMPTMGSAGNSSVANKFNAALNKATLELQNGSTTINQVIAELGKIRPSAINLTANAQAFTITWPVNVDWAGGSAPILTSSGVDVLVFYTYDAGVTYYGFVSAKNLS